MSDSPPPMQEQLRELLRMIKELIVVLDEEMRDELDANPRVKAVLDPMRRMYPTRQQEATVDSDETVTDIETRLLLAGWPITEALDEARRLHRLNRSGRALSEEL